MAEDGGFQPFVKPEHNTLILRELSSQTSTAEVIDIFQFAVGPEGKSCPPIRSIRSDMNDTWYVEKLL